MGTHHLRAAVEQGLVEHLRMLFAPPIGELGQEDEALWFVTGSSLPYENGILRAPLPSSPDEVRQRVAPFAERGVPMMWWVFPEEPLPAEVHDLFVRAEMSLDSDRPGMALDLSAWDPPPSMGGLEVDEVDESTFAEWRATVALGFGDAQVIESRATKGFRRRLGDGSFRHYLGRLRDEPVACVTLTAAGTGVSASNVAVIPQQRRHGLGTQILSHALSHAREMGAKVASLSADPLGTRLYEKVGFRTVCRHLTYVSGRTAPGPS